MGFVIYGNNFGSTQGTVTIGGISATIISWNSDGTSITVQVPNSLTSSSIPYTLIVTSSNSMFEATDTFQVDTPFECP
jgi:hypothetical protein